MRKSDSGLVIFERKGDNQTRMERYMKRTGKIKPELNCT